MIGDNETNFAHKFLLTNRQVSNLRQAFANYLSTDIKLSKMIQSGGFLGRLFGSLIKTGLPLIKNLTKSLAKSVLIPLGLTAATSAADAEMHKRMLGPGNTTTLIKSNDEMKDIIKIVTSFKGFGLLLKWVTETVQKEVKEPKGGSLSMLWGTLGASLLGNILAGKGVNTTGQRQGLNRAGKGRGREINRAGGEGVLRAGYGSRSSKMDF